MPVNFIIVGAGISRDAFERHIALACNSLSQIIEAVHDVTKLIQYRCKRLVRVALALAFLQLRSSIGCWKRAFVSYKLRELLAERFLEVVNCMSKVGLRSIFRVGRWEYDC